VPAATSRADIFSRGGVSLEGRAFDPDDVDETDDFGASLTTTLEVKYRRSPLIVQVRGTARLDGVDETRNIVNLEEAYASYAVGRLRLRVGSQILNWTATEAFHPSDVMNSQNLDGNPGAFEKLGEPIVEAQLRLLQGYLSVYYMPIRVPPRLVDFSSRLSLVPPGGPGLGDVLWIDRDGSPSDSLFANQTAVHLSQTIGRADVAVHLVDHADRHQPTFTFDMDDNTVRPTYHWVTQVGMTYTQVFGGLLAKVEAAHRMFRKPDAPDGGLPIEPQIDHDLVAAGLEYGWTTDAGHSATIIVEGQAVLEDRATRRQLDLFQGDLLIGYRHFLNDLKGKEVRLGFIVDLERPSEYIATFNYGQRLSDTWSIAGAASRARLLGALGLPGYENYQALVSLTRNF
jgi:hypothetical protein